jgi:hypothetical protein
MCSKQGNHNKFQSITDDFMKSVIINSWGKIRPASKATKLPSSASRLSRKCGSLDISKPYRLPRPVSGRALLFREKTTKYYGLQISPQVFEDVPSDQAEM